MTHLTKTWSYLISIRNDPSYKDMELTLACLAAHFERKFLVLHVLPNPCIPIFFNVSYLLKNVLEHLSIIE